MMIRCGCGNILTSVEAICEVCLPNGIGPHINVSFDTEERLEGWPLIKILRRDKRGGHLRAEVAPVHAHKCKAWRPSAIRHGWTCTCGADELFQAFLRDSTTLCRECRQQPAIGIPTGYESLCYECMQRENDLKWGKGE